MRREVWLYGSVARQTYTEHSDLDVLVLPRDSGDLDVVALTEDLPQRRYLSVTTYSWQEIDQMASYGSLFLLHLSLEGRLIHADGVGAGLEEVLATLPDYSRQARELSGFAMALDDGLESLQEGGDIRFELGIVGRAIRHASILACYLNGDPKFDRQASIESAFVAYGMNSSQLDRALALAGEIRRRDGQPFPVLPSRDEVLSLFGLAKTFVGRVAVAHGAA